MTAQSDATPEQLRRYEIARERLTIAYDHCKKQLSNAEVLHGSVTGSGFLLGEILLDAEMIAREQLNEALAEQAKTKPPLPLGRILVAKKILTWEQLAYFLRLQEILQLTPTQQQRLSRQLVELGLASRAEMETAEFDCETTGCSLLHAVTRRAWVQPSLLALLTGSSDKAQSKAEKISPTVLTGKVFAKSM